MVRQLQYAMAAALLMAAGRPVVAEQAPLAPAAQRACAAACTAARAACRDDAYRQGHTDVATLRRRAEPPLSAPEIATFMRRERDRLGVCESQRAACVQKCLGTATRAAQPAVDDSVHLSQS